MSFLYPRIISITRPISTSGIGEIPYQALQPNNETPVVSNIRASIQYDSTADRMKSKLPGDAYVGMRWKIFTRLKDIPRGTVKDNDVVTDDEGIRYQVSAAYWNSLGCNLKCERLQN